MNTETKSRENSLITTRRVVSHEHLNPNGILFGGYLMCWIDEIAFMCACRFTNKKSCVTVNIDNISFKFPLKLGEQIYLSARVNHSGKTSMEIEVTVEKESTESGERIHTNSAFLTFVCLNENFKPAPVPELILENAADEKAFWEARLRSRVRKRLGGFLQRKLKDEKFAVPKLLMDERLNSNFRNLAHEIKIRFKSPYSLREAQLRLLRVWPRRLPKNSISSFDKSRGHSTNSTDKQWP